MNFKRRFSTIVLLVMVSLSFCQITHAAITDDLVGYWPFDDDTANDATSNGNDGTLYGNTAFSTDTPSGSGKALTMGDSGYVTVPGNSATLGSASGLGDGFTVVFDLKSTYQGGYVRTVQRSSGGSTTSWWNFQITSANDIRITNNEGIETVCDAGFVRAQMADGTWHQVAVSIGAGAVNTYLDGVFKGSDTYTEGTGIDTDNNVSFGQSGSYGEQGNMDDIQIWKGVLSEGKVKALYHRIGNGYTAVEMNNIYKVYEGALASTVTDDGLTWTQAIGLSYGVGGYDTVLGVTLLQLDVSGDGVQGGSGVPDTDTPLPDPATFASAPAAISDVAIRMTATTGIDPSTPVEYYFDETSGNSGGSDSGWVTNPVYTDTGLNASTQYTYTVQMRDNFPNTGAVSAPASATTPDGPDTDPPTPDSATFASAPTAASSTWITMTATTGTDFTGPVEYYFDETSGNPGADDSGWTTNPYYSDVGLYNNTQYTYTVQMRDALLNLGTASTPVNVTTPPGSGASPVKIFILAGQSNMQGHGYAFHAPNEIGTLAYFLDEPGERPKYEHLVDDLNNWLTRDDVWVQYGDRGGDQPLISEPLVVGLGANYQITIGPELGFGCVLGDYISEQIVIIKTCWGGQSLAVDFRPPSSGGTTGPRYTQMLSMINDLTTNLLTYYPDYDGQGYEIVGFGWHQGWNDYMEQSYVDEYEVNMANFIRDVRTDLGIPDLPFVIAASAMTTQGWQSSPLGEQLIAAQAAPASYPEFAGTVAFTETRDFWRHYLISPWEAPSHWNGNFESYYLMGAAMGESMNILLGGTDGNPPTPNPATFASAPAAVSDSEITMTATAGIDPSGPVEYYFDEISGNTGGSDSGWVTNPVYNDTGLNASTQYTYTVQMRDSVPNTGTVSDPASATTNTPDFTPPTPDTMTWATVPYATGSTSIAMIATTATDVSGVEYYFTCTAGGGNDSGWQDNTDYENTGLDPNTSYTYTVIARDKSSSQNETAASPAESATTDPLDLTPPIPDPMTWDTVPYALGSTSIAMIATTATDDSGVEYYFTCTAGGGNDSGWQDNTNYEDTGLDPNTSYTYTVIASDKSSSQNTTAASSAESATTDTVAGPDYELVGYWQFDDDTADDATGNGNDGTLYGDAAYSTDTPSGTGKSLSMGDPGYATVPGDSETLGSTSGLGDAFTVVFDLKSTYAGSYVRTVQRAGGGSTTSWWNFQITTGSDIRIMNNEGTHTVCEAGITRTQIADGTWRQVAVSIGGGNFNTYLDGVLGNSGTYAEGTGIDTDQDVGFGQSGSYGERGSFDEIQIWKGALSEGKVIGLYNRIGNDYTAIEMNDIYLVYDGLRLNTTTGDGLTWTTATGLAHGVGGYDTVDGVTYLQLDDSGNGVQGAAPNPDLSGNGQVDLIDFAKFAAEWQDTACGDCNGADLTGDGNVTIEDLRIIAAGWMNGI